MLADCSFLGGSVFYYCKIQTKYLAGFLSNWLTSWLAAPLFAQLVGGNLIDLGKETDRMLADCWLVSGLVFFAAKLRLNCWLSYLEELSDCIAGGSPLWLAGWWLVDWIWQRDWQNVGWLLIGGWLGVFYCKMETKKWRDFLAVDWLHGWRLPSLLSWSVVGWLVLAKRLTECWLAVDWWVDRCFFTAILRLKTFFSSWLTASLAAPLFA